ncbi:MAG: HD domain-containing protein, partial [Trueperaceae bacterium]
GPMRDAGSDAKRNAGAPPPDAAPHARLDGAAGALWEPTWKLATRLSPLERSLLRTPQLRRLHYVVSGGAARFATPYVHTRLQHVLGVFALTAWLAPDRPDVRAAALLHDVGHPPFSHSLEALPEVDHHRWTEERIRAEPIAGLLRDAGLDVEQVLALAEGHEPSVLKNRDGHLHLDHLDSLVRGGRVRGSLQVAPARLREGLSADGPYVACDGASAERLEALIEQEAHLHVEPIDLGASAMLASLVRLLQLADLVRIEELPYQTDADLTALLFAAEATRDEARHLWLRPWALRQRRLGPEEALPDGAILAVKERLYLDLPYRSGEDATEREARRAGLEERLADLRGRYAVSWDPTDAPERSWTAALGPVVADAPGVPDLGDGAGGSDAS